MKFPCPYINDPTVASPRTAPEARQAARADRSAERIEQMSRWAKSRLYQTPKENESE
jgi:hypothetical protein